MKNQLISIIIPCYNQAQYLPDALQSVLEQTYANWECIIVNDGSPDNTEAVAKKWVDKDDRFKYVFQENGGLSSARNAGLDFATGDYIQFLDSDDYLGVNKISKSLTAIKDNSVQNIIVSNFIFFNNVREHELKSNYNLNQDLLSFYNILYLWDSFFNIPIHCGFFSVSLFSDFRFPEKLGAKEDWIMWLCIFQKEVFVHFVDETLAYYREHPASMTKNKNHMHNNTIKALKFMEGIINKEDYNDYLLYLVHNKMLDYNNLILKYEDLNRRVINSNNSIGFKIEKKIRYFFNKSTFK